MGCEEERSNFPSDISQWLNVLSVMKISQNASCVITGILLVCLPVNQLGNQQKHTLYSMADSFSSLHQQYFIRFSSWFRFTVLKALLITRLVTKCFMERQRCERRLKKKKKCKRTNDCCFWTWWTSEPVFPPWELEGSYRGSLRRGQVIFLFSHTDHLIQWLGRTASSFLQKPEE